MKKYIYGFLVVFGLLAFPSCSDDDNGGALTSEAPRIVSSLPADGAIDVRAENGVLTLQITYDQNVKITEDKPLEKIQILRSEAAVTAVTAKDKVVSVTVSGCEDGKNYEVYIPKGVVLAEDGTEAYAVRLSFTADVIPVIIVPDQTVAENLSNPNATQEAKDLYGYLKENYRTNMISGAMALDAATGYHSWNYEYAAWVGENAGKTPKLNGYDFGHMTSSPANWIDYSDTDPVTGWRDANGIVSCMWHWNVPTENPEEVVPENVLVWEGTHEVGSWQGLILKGDEGYAALKSVKARDKIVITFEHSGDANYTKVTLQNVVDWQNLDTTSELYTEDLSVTSFVYTVSDQTASLIQNGMQVTGENYTLKKVEIQQDGTVTYGFYAPGGNNGNSETPFNATNAVTEGTWEKEWIETDMEKLYDYLKPLADANVPIIWRPLHEASGAWFWWGAQGAETYKALWKKMYDYLVKEKGLNNLIWVWTAEKDDDDWYPGDEYVDIIGRDIYDQPEAYELAAEYAALAGRFPNKMIALSECGNVANIADMWDAGAKWAWFMVWYPGSSDGTNATVTWEQFAATQWWTNAFGLDYVIARE